MSWVVCFSDGLIGGGFRVECRWRRMCGVEGALCGADM